MKTFLCFLLALLPALGQARPCDTPAADPSQALVQQANTPGARQQLRAALGQQPGGYLNGGRFEVGCLYLLSGRRVPVLGLRYHVGQRVVEVQDSLQVDSISYWPLSALRGFDIGAEEEPATLCRYRAHLVHERRRADHREAVQLLTATDACPLVLAYLPLLLPGTNTPAQVLLAGPGRDANRPLRPLDTRAAEVLHLVGERASKVRSFALDNNLHYCTPTEIARMLDYYNQLAVAVL